MKKSSLCKKALYYSSIASFLASAAPAPADAASFEPLREPRVLASENGVLNVLMVAARKRVPELQNVTGWVYSICKPDRPNQLSCPANSETIDDYGGAQLAVQPGDLLKIRLVNQLPKITDAANATGHNANLAYNPTNLHTHGLIVQPRVATFERPSFGDNVFVTLYNRYNVPWWNRTIGRPDMHGSIVSMNAVDYEIDIPRNHPLGSFFFHPHVHGLALNQMSMGLSGLISVGRASDYAHGNRDNANFSDANVRNIILKDMQVLKSNIGLSQQSPDFCAPDVRALRGFCAGAGDYEGGRWFFTLNGQLYPRIDVTSPDGEIWRITNSSGNVTYNLQIDDGRGRVLTTQLLSVDGVTINLPVDTPPDTIVKLAGGRFKVRPCPGAAADQNTIPACVTEMTLMPSARAEVWVSYRDASGAVATSRSAQFILRQKQVQMGTGDTWPAVNLASVTFNQTSAPDHADRNIRIVGDAYNGFRNTGIFRKKVPYAERAPLPAGCAALPAGHRRRVFFGVDQTDGSFGLGY
jgi:FtsP/CotA-like multicopper oxidase with cupredoxin domain